eukprot:5312385-Prymnesium_polylepis.2
MREPSIELCLHFVFRLRFAVEADAAIARAVNAFRLPGSLPVTAEKLRHDARFQQEVQPRTASRERARERRRSLKKPRRARDDGRHDGAGAGAGRAGRADPLLPGQTPGFAPDCVSDMVSDNRVQQRRRKLAARRSTFEIMSKQPANCECTIRTRA